MYSTHWRVTSLLRSALPVSQGCRFRYAAFIPPHDSGSWMPSNTTFTSSISFATRAGACSTKQFFGESVTQSMAGGNWQVPLVSIAI